jgi:hypothetical protein
MVANVSNQLTEEQAAIMAKLKDQLIVALLTRLGSEIRIGVSELDATGDSQLIMQADHATQELIFKAAKRERDIQI